MIRRLASLAVASTMVLWACVAQAAPADVEACADAYEDAQRQQGKGALLAAREQAASCAKPTCPAGIVSVCTALADELDKTIPTIVVATVDPEGRDVGGATLVVDGREPGASLDGRPIPLDPGPHALALTPASAALEPAKLDVTVLAGERNRRVEVRFTRKTAAPGADAPPPRKDDGSGPSTPVVVAYAVGGVGLAVGIVTGALALGEDASLSDVCETPTTCPRSEQGSIDTVETLGIVSTTGFVVGALGVATGVVLWAVGSGDDDRAAVSSTGRGVRVRF